MDERFVVDTWHYVLAKHAQAMCQLERELGDRHGLGPSEFEVLDRIVHHDRKLRIQELCDEVHLSQSALSRVVARLEKAALVTRGVCDSDRRGVFVCITDEGRARHAEALPTQRAVLTEVFADAPVPAVP
ncbi:Transcriptional regulator, MarR family [[Actinomadura] parvosata subsp. kistnae]|uniref:MarR family transcriptional regulator n=1 Tax=[Actinomadura] parvosata subsp. kistnae TaxID=1909395 RepID=A0A1V0A964_9ACTN|nr:MarR family transcriptional regulator [Nonomuraea sp. ATCC 55076]AQZ66746.1 MarR family transcriptional regulator [Nonomuraea sp. ATCC 55076]SPL95131.1 Transcriptional regulator, MarR family [Actinomadura parvosata subsp. kistnae]